jgi:hypothetical protein
MNVAFDYIEIPLLFGWQPKRTSKITWKLGFYFADGLGGSGRIAFVDGSNQLFEANIDNVFKSQTYLHNGETYTFRPFSPWDIGIKFGYDWNFYKHLVLRPSFAIGILNLNQPDDKRMRNSSVTVSIGYQFK